MCLYIHVRGNVKDQLYVQSKDLLKIDSQRNEEELSQHYNYFPIRLHKEFLKKVGANGFVYFSFSCLLCINRRSQFGGKG